MAYGYPNFAVAGVFSGWRGVMGAVLVVLAASAARAEDQEAQKLLREASKALERHRWVSVKLHHQIDLYHQELIGNGLYRQGPTDTHWMLLDLKFQLANESWVVQERCDGHTHWRSRGVNGVRVEVTRVDVERLRTALDVAGAAEGHVGLFGLGGLPKLLSALEQSFEFKSFANATLEGGRPVYALRGQWPAEKLAKWLPGEREALLAGRPVDLDKLPPPLPDHVFVLLGRDDLFPYRIEYGRDDPQAVRKSRILAAVNLDDPVFDKPVDAGEFAFEPGGAPVVDLTETYLSKLGAAPERR